MSDSRREISLGFVKEKIPEGNHIVYIYNDEKERNKIVSNFIESGLLEKEKVLCLVDTMSPEEMKKEMAELGVDLEGVELQVANKVYRPDGFFSSQDMLDVVDGFYNQALQDGFSGTRGTAEMSWALDETVTPYELMKYEAELTDVLVKYPHTGLCQYDARKFSGTVIMDALSVHPILIVRGQLVKNPHYIEPSEFLKSYKERSALH